MVRDVELTTVEDGCGRESWQVISLSQAENILAVYTTLASVYRFNG